LYNREAEKQLAFDFRQKFAWLRKVYWKEYIIWSPGYFVSIGLDEKSIFEYARWQKTQDLGKRSLNCFKVPRACPWHLSKRQSGEN